LQRNFGKTKKKNVNLSVLSEVRAMDGFGSEHGLSFLIEVDQKRILFDTGASGLFKNSASKLGIHLDEIDLIVLSHGHWDHGDGLQYMEGIPLICHPGCFVKRYRKSGGDYLGLSLTEKEAGKRFDLQTSPRPVLISEHLWFLGEIPRWNGFEAKSTKYILEDGTEDFILDDSGMVCVTDHGLVVISGCAHAGICNVVEKAMAVTGVSKVAAVIGGFHLRAFNNQVRRTISYLKNLGVEQVIPSHCTFDPALEEFHKMFGKNELQTGMCLVF
jgi:7,8-dihydropterin-6-yl-methyl-4-(beta-D-ribofuranosyl)aminobenzene 5'-phosphate synthase